MNNPTQDEGIERIAKILKLKRLPDDLKPNHWITESPYISDEQLIALHRLMLKERLKELETLEANSDCIEDGCGLDAELLRDNLLKRITTLTSQITGSKS